MLPGSRRGEVSRIFPTLLEAAQLLGPEYVYIVPVASTLDAGWMASFLRDYTGPPITFTRDARASLLHARAAAVASGTSTLEAALIGTPFAMVYRVAPLTWSLGRRLVKVDRFAMVNLIAERDVVPELVQDDFTPQRVCAELRRLIPDGEARETMIAGLRGGAASLASQRCGRHASERAAQAVLACWGEVSSFEFSSSFGLRTVQLKTFDSEAHGIPWFESFQFKLKLETRN